MITLRYMDKIRKWRDLGNNAEEILDALWSDGIKEEYRIAKQLEKDAEEYWEKRAKEDRAEQLFAESVKQAIREVGNEQEEL